MDRAIMALIDRELVSALGEYGDDDMPVFAGRAEEQIAARERGLSATEERLRGWSERLRLWEDELRDREQQVEPVTKLAARQR